MNQQTKHEKSHLTEASTTFIRISRINIILNPYQI